MSKGMKGTVINPTSATIRGKARDGRRVDSVSVNSKTKHVKVSKNQGSETSRQGSDQNRGNSKSATVKADRKKVFVMSEESEGAAGSTARRLSNPSVLKPGVLVTKDSTTSSKGTQSPSRRLPGQTNRYNESQRSNAGPGKLDKRSILFSSCVEDKTPIHLTNLYARDIAEQYDLQPWHLRRMKRRFDDIDLDRSGNISAEEFLEATGSIRSPFTDKLFALMDLDGSGTIEFDEFVAVLVTYCTMSKNEILKFCFECFDVDRSGAIDEREFVLLCKAVHGDGGAAFPTNFTRALEDFDVNEDGLIDYNEFISIERRYPMILFPAFKLQDSMQQFSLGESNWLRVLESYHRKKKIDEFKRIHGKPPPESFSERVMRYLAVFGSSSNDR